MRVSDARLDARLNGRIDSRAPERRDSRASEPTFDWINELQWQPERPDSRAPDAELHAPTDLPDARDHIGDCRMNDYASVSHPYGEALGPGAQWVCAEREKNAKSAGHTRRSIHRGGAQAC